MNNRDYVVIHSFTVEFFEFKNKLNHNKINYKVYIYMPELLEKIIKLVQLGLVILVLNNFISECKKEEDVDPVDPGAEPREY